MRNSFLIIIFLTSCAYIAKAQDRNDVYQRLNSAIILLNAKQYERAIQEADAGVLLYFALPKDSLYTELLRVQYISYSWLDDFEKAQSLCYEATSIYESFGKKDIALSRFCRSFCNLKCGTVEERHQCVMNIFRTGYYQYSDFTLYSNSLYASSVVYEEDFKDILRVLDSDEDEIKGFNIPLLFPYSEFLKAEYSSFSEAIPLLNDAIERASNYEKDETRDRFLYDFHSSLYKAYEHNGLHTSAAIHYKQMLDLTSEYWQSWDLASPWSTVERYVSAHLLKGFDLYVECLWKSSQYDEIINYCKTVLEDDRLKGLDNVYTQHVLEELESAYLSCGDRKSADNARMLIEGLNQEMQMEKLSDQYCILADEYWEKNDTTNAVKYAKLALDSGWDNSFGVYHSEFDNYLFSLLYQAGEFNTVSGYAEQWIQRILEKETSHGDETSYPVDDQFIALCSKDDFVLGDLRECFHHVGANGNPWISYYYLGLVAQKDGNNKKAIECQKRCVDIVRTDWWADPTERDEILKSNKEDSIERYLDTEVSMLLQLGEYYAEANLFPDAFKTIKNTIDLNIDVICAKTSFGSEETKESEWRKRESTFIDIEKLLLFYYTQYPPFTQLLSQVASIRNGFILDNYRFAYSQDSHISSKTNNLRQRIQELNIEFERSFYMDGRDLKEIVQELEYNQGVLLDQIGQRDHQLLLSCLNDVAIQDDAVIVLFFSVPSSLDVSYIQCTYETVNETKTRAFEKNQLYALVYRNGWENAKVIDIGSVRDLITKTDFGLFEYLVGHGRLEVNTLYNSTDAYHTLCEPIILASEIKDGESIYYIPTDIINEIALENLLTDDGVHHMFERYNVSRFSRVNDTHFDSKRVNQTDSVIAFNGTNTLFGATNEISFLKQIHPDNTTIVSGDLASESYFYSLSNRAPSVIHFGTHGFNYLDMASDSIADMNRYDYLFGNRNMSSTPLSTKAMYLTGLLINQDNSAKEIPTNGFLTAKEISMMDLTGCKLVVLSACSTGLGAISSEGVYGLQRGFKMAGVDTLLVSLWDVDDTATEVLMKEFYNNYFNGFSASDALTLAKKYVKEYEDDGVDEFGNISISESPKKFGDPYYWAGFVLID